MFYDIDLNTDPHDIRLFLHKNDNNRTEIGELHEAKNKVLLMNYGGVGELTFHIPYKIKQDMKYVKNPNFDKLLGDYLIRYVDNNKTIFFKITNPENIVGENGEEERIIRCHELHYEWKDKIVRLYQGTKKFYDPVNGGVIDETLMAKTEWDVDYIDASILTKHRTFDESQTNLLEFIFSASSRYGNVIPVVDTVARKVSFYLDENIAIDEGLEITYGKYLKSLNQNENFDDIVTRLYVYGKDNISINSVNPTGMDYIESFDYYLHGYETDENGNVISHSPHLSDGLCQAILDYEKLVESKRDEFSTLLNQRSDHEAILLTKQNELFQLDTELNQLEDTKAVYIANGMNLSQINSQIAAKKSQINAKQSEIDTVNTNIANVDNQIKALRDLLSLENNFTQEQIIERSRFIKESVWQDSNYTSPQDLYEEAISKIHTINQPIVEYTISSVDFVQALNTEDDWHKLKLGAVVTIRYPNYGISIKAKIISFEHNIDERTISLTIANVKDIKSGIKKIMNLLNRSASTSAYIDLNKYKINNGDLANTQVQQLLNESWDANKRAILSGSNLNYRLDSQGLTLMSPDDPNNYLRGVHNVLAITNDGGNTWKNALTWRGVVAERLYGQLIAGQDLLIQNESGTFTVDGNGATLTDMDLTLVRSDTKSRVRINSTTGITIDKNTGTVSSPVWSSQLSLDSNGNALFGGTISIGTGNNVIKADGTQGLWLGSNNFSSAKFRVDMQGNAYANTMTLTNSTFAGGYFTGDILSTGKIKGGIIEGDIVRAIVPSNPNQRIELSQHGFRTYNPFGVLEGVTIDLSAWDYRGGLKLYLGGSLQYILYLDNNRITYSHYRDVNFGHRGSPDWNIYVNDNMIFEKNVNINNANWVVSTASNVGASGSASPTPSAPMLYAMIKVNNINYKIPLYRA